MDERLFLQKLAAAGFTLERLSEELGVTVRVIRDRMRGRSEFTAEEIERIISICGFSAADMMQIFFPECCEKQAEAPAQTNPFLDLPKITMAAARVNAGLMQKDAAALLGLSKATLSSYERYLTFPPLDVFLQMGELYGYPIDLIYIGTADQPLPPAQRREAGKDKAGESDQK